MPAGTSGAPPVVGFCFSFPVEQTALDAGTVARLTKRFENEGLLGCNPVQMLTAALERANFPARCPVRLRANPSLCLSSERARERVSFTELAQQESGHMQAQFAPHLTMHSTARFAG